MKKIFSFLFVALFSVSMWADIKVGAKVPAEWTDDIYVFIYDSPTDADNGFKPAIKSGDWWNYTYTGSQSSINVIFVNGNSWTGDSNQTDNIPSVSSDSYYEVTYNSSGKCTVAQQNFYVAIHANFNGDKDTPANWATEVLNVADDKLTASRTFTRAHGAWLNFGMRIGSSGNWTSNGLQFNRGDEAKEITSGSGECYFQADKAGEYTFTWTYATNKLEITWPNLTLENGWYLVGIINGSAAWDYGDLTAAKKFTPNGGDEFVVTAEIATNDHLKAAYVFGDVIENYKPTDANKYYTVDADHAGTSKSIYFNQATEQPGAGWSNNFYVPENSGTALDNTTDEAKAIKLIENGQLVIIKNGVKYNALGAEVK